MIGVWLIACASAPLEGEARWGEAGLHLELSAPIERAQVLDPQGVPLLTERPAARTGELDLRLWPQRHGAYTVSVRAAGQDLTLSAPWPEDAPPALLLVEAPLGQQARALAPGETLPLILVDGEAVGVGVTAVAMQEGPLRLELAGQEVSTPLARPGERLRWTGTLSQDQVLTLEAGARRWTAQLSAQALPQAQVARDLALGAVVFPAEAGGGVDLARPADRVQLPSPLWQALLDHSALGFRPQDLFLPWAWQSLTLENRGQQDLNVAVRATTFTEGGQPVPGFRPRMRDADDGTGAVSVLIRVPAGASAVATTPLFVDPEQLEPGTYTRVLEVTPLGLDQALIRWEGPLHVSRGSTPATLGLLGALLAAASGMGLLLRSTPRWLREAQTSELALLAMMGALLFFLGAAGRLIAMGVAAALGPFAVLLTALVDDAARAALLATLLTLRPRPGSATLAMLVAWLLSAVGLGGITPADLIFFAAQISWTEGALWLSGITRGGAWRDQGPWARWARLSFAFVLSGGLGLATGLSLTMTLFRLYYAPWYVAMLLLGPGILYNLIACALAVPFAASLRRVQP